MDTADVFTCDVARHVWDTKYRHRDGDAVRDATVEDTWRRIASNLASAEGGQSAHWAERFYAILKDFRFLPGGRIQAGAGTERTVTLFNCFVMGIIDDSMDGIFDGLKEGALTMQQGGGVGYDFSTLRPRGTRAHHTGMIASGPVSFMQIWDSTCATILSTGARRGAMMATLRCDHPDIEEFVEAKRTKAILRHFNVSVLVTDAFMEAVRQDEPWPLVFPSAAFDSDTGTETVMRRWSGADAPVPCRVLKRIAARELWRKIIAGAYACAEPGIIFIDRVNQQNNLWYRENISATNPCGELPLPPYGACNLGSLNLTQFVRKPFSDQAWMDYDSLTEAAEVATRLLDNVIDQSRFPLPQQAEQAHATRRIGLGLTGLADALIMLGQLYDSDQARHTAASIMKAICHAAYGSSIALARDKGPFPAFERGRFLESRFVSQLPDDIRDGIAKHGIRNSHTLAVAPTGTISLLANNVSSGLEPVFAAEYDRRVIERDGTFGHYSLVDYAVGLWRSMEHGNGRSGLPPAYVDTNHLSPDGHLRMQAALQPHVDGAISKTINVPGNFPFAQFANLFDRAYELGLKGCTAFRPNPVTESVLAVDRVEECAWCGVEREAD